MNLESLEEMNEENVYEVFAMFSAWEEFKRSTAYQELVIDGHPLSMLAVFNSGWRAKRSAIDAQMKEGNNGNPES